MNPKDNGFQMKTTKAEVTTTRGRLVLAKVEKSERVYYVSHARDGIQKGDTIEVLQTVNYPYLIYIRTVEVANKKAE